MQRNFKTILFTSNLSETSRAAFSHAALLAACLKAKLILLHVIEITPISYENLLIKLFGEKKMTEILDRHRKEAQSALIEKIPSRQMASTALNQFCRDHGIDDEQCGAFEYEIIIKAGDVVNTIIEQAGEHHCDMIVMGASDGILSGSTLGSTIRDVLNTDGIPTLVVSSKP